MNFDYVSLRRLERFFADLKGWLSGIYAAKDELVPVTNAEIDSMFIEGIVIGGRKYPYVKIGNQLWTTQNLDWKFDGCNIGNMTMTTSSKEAGYYNNDESTYGITGKKYGLLYNWAAVDYIEQNKSTMLPEGWQVPSSSDYGTLVNFIGNNAASIKSTTEWNGHPGTDTYGLSLYPSGGCFNGVGFTGLSTDCYLWTSSVPVDAICVYLASTMDNINYTGQTTKMNYMPLRLVKNLS